MLSNVGAIYLKELRSYFVSFVAYALIALFLVLVGYFFLANVFLSKTASLEGWVYNSAIILIFVAPLITMRLLSEEKKTGTLELLLTRPIKEWEIVLGKFLAVTTLLLAMLLPTLVYAGVLLRYAQPDRAPMLTQYAAILLIGLSFAAIGLFASSLTESQVVAAFLSFTFILVMWLLSWFTSSLGPDNVLSYFAISSHFDDLSKGIVDAKDVVFYISFILFFLFITTKVIDSKRWA
jgi:ABC-2 type transport system permease protein